MTVCHQRSNLLSLVFLLTGLISTQHEGFHDFRSFSASFRNCCCVKHCQRPFVVQLLPERFRFGIHDFPVQDCYRTNATRTAPDSAGAEPRRSCLQSWRCRATCWFGACWHLPFFPLIIIPQPSSSLTRNTLFDQLSRCSPKFSMILPLKFHNHLSVTLLPSPSQISIHTSRNTKIHVKRIQ